MIFLLADHARKTTADLLLALGLKGAQVLTNGKRLTKEPRTGHLVPGVVTNEEYGTSVIAYSKECCTE